MIGRIRNHKARAQALMTGAFRDKPIARGTVAVFTGSAQRLEDAAWEVLLNRYLSWGAYARVPYDSEPGEDVIVDAQGVQLDVIGAIVGEPRAGRPDIEYNPAVRLRAVVNRSRGTPDDLIKIGRTANPDATIYYNEYGPIDLPGGSAVLPGSSVTVNPMNARAGRVAVIGAPGGIPCEFIAGQGATPAECLSWSRADGLPPYWRPDIGSGVWGSVWAITPIENQGVWARVIKKPGVVR